MFFIVILNQNGVIGGQKIDFSMQLMNVILTYIGHNSSEYDLFSKYFNRFTLLDMQG